MSISGKVLGVVEVKISLKNVQQAGRLYVVRAAYRKFQKESGEPESKEDVLSTLQLQEEDISSALGIADTQHYMQPCVIAVQDFILKVIISGFQVLTMPLGSLAVATQITQNPCRLVLLGKTNACLFQLGQDTERVALFVQLESADEANKLISIVSDQTAAVSNTPAQLPTDTSQQSKGQTFPVVTSTEEVPDKTHINIVRRRLSQIESQTPSEVTPPERLSDPAARPKLPPKPMLKTPQRPNSQLYENVAQLKTVVREELGMKLKLTGVLLPPMNKEELELRRVDRQGQRILLRRQSSDQSTENLETVPKQYTGTVYSERIATESKDEVSTGKLSLKLPAQSSLTEEENGDTGVSAKAGDCDSANDRNSQNYEKPYELTSNFELTSEENANAPVFENNLENAGYLTERTSAGEYLGRPILFGCSDRESKIIIDLLDDEKQHVNVLQDLQNVFSTLAPGSDFHRVVERLLRFHGLVFCPALHKITKDFKREIAEAFTENRDSFKIYEELLMIHYRHSSNENMGNYRDKLLITLTQLQRYKIALSVLNDGIHEDKTVMQEAKDVIDGTLDRADSYLLLDSISGFPFTPDQCRSLIHKGTMKIKNKSLSRSKDHLVVLIETHLIIAEKSSSQKKNRYSGCIRMDTLSFEGETVTSFTIRGIIHPGSGKMTKFTFTAHSAGAASSWVKAIKQVLEKRNCSSIIFPENGKSALM